MPEVKQVKTYLDRVEASGKRIAVVRYFQLHYPNYKFIFQDQVNAVCKKYGLMSGPVSSYIGTIPEKNLREIEGWRACGLKKEDIHYHCYTSWLSRSYSHIGNLEGYIYDQVAHYINNPEEYGQIDIYPTEKNSLVICAPEQDFEWPFIPPENTRIDDPVVLQPVNGGYLIITAWGPKSTEEHVVNHRLN